MDFIKASEKFLFDKYSEMPMAIKVISYLSILFLVIYVSLLPSEINGKCEIPKENKKSYMPCYDVGLVLNINGNTVNSRLNRQGHWSVPVVDRIPRKIKIEFVDLQTNARNTVKINRLSILRRDFIRIEQDLDEEAFKLVEDTTSILPTYNSASVFSISPSFFQDEGQIEENNLAQITPKIPFDSIRAFVFERTAEILELDGDSLKTNLNLVEFYKMDRLQSIELVNRLQNDFDVTIPPEDWYQLNTVYDISLFISKTIQNPSEMISARQLQTKKATEIAPSDSVQVQLETTLRDIGIQGDLSILNLNQLEKQQQIRLIESIQNRYGITISYVDWINVTTIDTAIETLRNKYSVSTPFEISSPIKEL